ncbi:MAG: response regulator transcription factor [Spirochaetales bacterium]
MSQRILVADDNTDLAEGLSWYLEAAGFEVLLAADGAEALRRFDAEQPALVILDIMMPLVDGVTVCEKLRRRSQVPILMLSAKDGEIDKVRALDKGADDYVTKPFSAAEVVSRIKALLRRSSQVPLAQATYRWSTLEIWVGEHRVLVLGKDVVLTNLEFDVLVTLVKAPQRVHTRQVLIDQAWGDGETYHVGSRQVDNLVYRLREKLEMAGLANFPIVTIRGVGYAFRPQN